MRALREIERVDWCVLGAWRCIDAATGTPVALPVEVTALAEAQIIRNRSGLYVVNRHTLLASHSNAFAAPPAAPPVGSVTLTVTLRDPSGFYLARTAQIRLPRDPQPANAGTLQSLFGLVDVELYRLPSALRSAPTGCRCACRSGSKRAATRSAARSCACAATAAPSPAACPIGAARRWCLSWACRSPPGPGRGSVVATAIDATLEVFPDASAGGARMPAADVAAGRAPRVCCRRPTRREQEPIRGRYAPEIGRSAGPHPQPLAVSVMLDLSD